MGIEPNQLLLFRVFVYLMAYPNCIFDTVFDTLPAKKRPTTPNTMPNWASLDNTATDTRHSCRLSVIWHGYYVVLLERRRAKAGHQR